MVERYAQQAGEGPLTYTNRSGRQGTLLEVTASEPLRIGDGHPGLVSSRQPQPLNR